MFPFDEHQNGKLLLFIYRADKQTHTQRASETANYATSTETKQNRRFQFTATIANTKLDHCSVERQYRCKGTTETNIHYRSLCSPVESCSFSPIHACIHTPRIICIWMYALYTWNIAWCFVLLCVVNVVFRLASSLLRSTVAAAAAAAVVIVVVVVDDEYRSLLPPFFVLPVPL